VITSPPGLEKFFLEYDRQASGTYNAEALGAAARVDKLNFVGPRSRSGPHVPDAPESAVDDPDAARRPSALHQLLRILPRCQHNSDPFQPQPDTLILIFVGQRPGALLTCQVSHRWYGKILGEDRAESSCRRNAGRISRFADRVRRPLTTQQL
jgi:hypothetical protein